jgi:hypothetical protein
MPFQAPLDALKAERYARTPLHATLALQRAVDQLLASGLAERALQAGDRLLLSACATAAAQRSPPTTLCASAQC